MVNTFFKTSFDYEIWLGISVKDLAKPANETDNNYVFSDGTSFNDTEFVFKWFVIEPEFGDYKCAYIDTDETLVTSKLGIDIKRLALCKVDEDCEDATSRCERFRVNLSVFALLMACTFFNTFFALAGSV